MHPLGRYTVPFGIALLVLAFLWWVLGPIVGYVQQFWPALAIALGIAGMLWAFATERARRAIEGFLQVPFARGILIAALLTAVYGGALWLLYGLGASRLQDQLGVEQRWAWLLVTVLGFLSIPVIWRIYAATGIPGDPVAIGRGFRVLIVVALIFFAWWYHNTPNRFFDLKTGKALFWVAEREGRVYYSDGFSPETGEKLRLGRPGDVARYRRAPWAEPLRQLFGASPPAAPLELQSLEVPLRKGERVDIGSMIPACTRLTFEVKAGEAWLSRGSGEPERLEGKGLKFPWREPMVLTGDGTAVLWLFNPGKSC